MVLSALVRDMVVAELGVLRTGLCGARPPGSLYIHGARVGAGLWPLVWRGERAVGVGSLIRPSEGGWSGAGGTGGVRGHPLLPRALEGVLATA